MSITEEQRLRFQRARDAIVQPRERERNGIGTQMEKTVHAVCKQYVDPDPSHQEIPVGSYIADIYDGEKITEIQTGSFAPLRAKLSAFLPSHKVEILHPIPHEKWLTWIDPESGALSRRTKSPVTGSFYHAFRELYQIRMFLKDPNLAVRLVLLDMEEYRVQDGWGRDGKRGSHRYDRIPEKLVDELVLREAKDYNAFLPDNLPEQFTSREFASLATRKKVRTVSPSTMLLVLSEQGVVTKTGKRGNSYLWSAAGQETEENKKAGR